MITFSSSLTSFKQLNALDYQPVKLLSQIAILVEAITTVAIASSILAAQAATGRNDPGKLMVSIATISQASIEYKTNNGFKINGQAVESFEIPHLVLYRNEILADPEARTIRVEIAGINVPPGGAYLSLDVTTRHPNFDPTGTPAEEILVWQESIWIENRQAYTQTGLSVKFTHTFTPSVRFGSTLIPTPTDYYDLSLAVVGEAETNHEMNQVRKLAPAFLLENQWIAPLPQVPEVVDGAAPDELVVYYCDMFPFQRVADNPGTRLPREHIPGYIGKELVPAMLDAFQTQSQDWGFSWVHPWSSWRIGDYQGQLSVALSDGENWFHGLAALQGNAGISINPSNVYLKNYHSLTDGIMSTFYHEVFHNMQRSMQLAEGGSGNVGGMSNEWAFFSEGTAVLASSIGQPDLQFEMGARRRAYMRNASTFIGLGLFTGDLNKSYAHMVPLHTTIYWRFLYEQCGGWDIIWRALSVLYAGEIVNPDTSSDLLLFLAPIMDRALVGSTCPFQNYHDSLMAFARAIYFLRSSSGRCQEMNLSVSCAFYDPNSIYPAPVAASLELTREKQTFADRINSSYGIDFLEIDIPVDMDGNSLFIELQSGKNSISEFSVQLLWLKRVGTGKDELVLVDHKEIHQITTKNRRMTYMLSDLNRGQFNTLALILVRTDTEEGLDPLGYYFLQVHSSESECTEVQNRNCADHIWDFSNPDTIKQVSSFGKVQEAAR